MFEELRRKLSRKATPAEEITFKPMEDVEVPETREALPTPAETRTETAETQLKVIRPESYEEVSSVADSLLAGCTVVLNTEAVDRASMIRMLDFLNGVTYCTDGEIKKVAASTFIITPHTGIDVSDL